MSGKTGPFSEGCSLRIEYKYAESFIGKQPNFSKPVVTHHSAI
jgi:hypothetical protein